MSDVAKRIEGLSPAKRRALRQRLVKQKGAAPKAAIPRRPRGRGPLPLSFGQERLWFIAELEPESGVYNTFYALRFRGELAVPALAASFLDVAGRHESLRTTFAAPDGQPIQVVHAAPPDFPLPVVALERLPAADREAAVKHLVAAAADQAFDLARGPLLRPVLMRLAPREHILLVVIHHIVSDGWSLGVLVREVAALYQARTTGRPSPLPELPIQYADFALWQRQWLVGEVLDEEVAYWRRKLAGAPPRLELPCDRPRALRRSYRGTTLGLRLEPELTAALRALSAEQGSTLFVTLLTGFAILLGRYSGQSDVVVGSPVANRQRTELEGLIGFLLNTLALRIDLGGDSPFEDRPFTELLGRVREVTLAAFAHQDLPFAKVVEELQPERDLGQTPFYQVMLVLQSAPPATFQIPGLVIEPLDNEDQPEDLDFTFFLFPEEDGLCGRLRYSVELYDATTIRRLLGHFRVLMAGIAADGRQRLSALLCLSAGERQQLLAEWNDTRWADLRSLPIHRWFEHWAHRTPAAVAVVFEDQVISYAELEARANRHAHQLRSLGVGPEVLVGVFMERSVELVVALLATLKAGGSYVPLDSSYPDERVAFMLEDSGTPVVLTREGAGQETALPPGVKRLAVAGGSGEDPGPPAVTVADENLAYVIYTSGSTGKPKGVMNSHAGIRNRLQWMQAAYALTAADAVMQKTPFSFDVSVWEFFWPLLVGSRLVVARPGGHQDGAYLAKLITAARVTTMHFVPSMLRAFLDEPQVGDCRSLKRVIASGEALPAELAERFYQHLPAPCRLHNLYGPTEAAIDVTYHPCAPGELVAAGVPIGRPLANTRLAILDRTLRPLPIGIPGELYLGGVQLARGYLRRPQLTARTFVPDPLAGPDAAGERLYRTGDLARYLSDGEVEFLGRIDHQVKLRGFRIELGEIESVLASHPAVTAAVVVVRGEMAAATLVAYLVPAGDGEPGPDALRRHLRESLPDYMVPAAFVVLDELPLLPNGKVNRRALPAPEALRPQLETAFMPPTTELEKGLAAIWQEVLDLEQVGLDDNFFDVGGHSLLLAQVRVKTSELVGRDVPLMELFRHPDIRSLAALLSGEEPIREHPAPAVVGRAQPGAEIAIIGMSARFAGASSVEEFWHNLCGGVESIRRLSVEELEAAGVDPEIYRAPDYVPACADVRDPDRFDAALFGFNPREAEILDPQHRVLLECAWQALESAGYDPIRYPERIGVFAGAGMSRYAMNVFTNPELVQSLGMAPLMFAVGQDFLAPRISYKLNLTGPSMVVQTACSTSLVAVHLARQALVEGGCEMALAGGVTLLEHPPQGYRYLEGGIQSSDGHCRAFDAAGQGMVSSSGAGVVVLKRLDEALADGDHIHAVVKATAVNNDGSVKVGFTAPSEEGQAKVIRNALQAAGAAAESIGFVEGHGTATPLGDPIEVAALTRVFREGTARRGFCALGSVKTNVGHADAAAGAASLIKAALAVEHGLVPPSLHFEQPNPAIDLADTPFYVPTELRPWNGEGAPRRAGVSSFGIGGTNAHAILEQAPPPPPSGPSRRCLLLVLSARSESALETMTDNLAQHLRAHPELSSADAAFSLQVGRAAFEHRRILVCAAEEAAAALVEHDRMLTAAVPREQGVPPVVFLFPGQGAQYLGMGSELYDDEPTFRAEVDRCCELLEPHLGTDLREVIALGSGTHGRTRRSAPTTTATDLDQTAMTQPALYVVEYALARLWMEWGVRPQALLGHSIGEYVAATLAGVLTLEDALSLVAARGRLMQETPTGAMLSIALPAEEVLPLLDQELELAAVNSPGLCVVSGASEAVDALREAMVDRQVQAKVLRTSHAFHSLLMEPILDRFRREVEKVELKPPQIPYLSNLSGTWIRTEEAVDPGYWVRHLRNTVRFSAAVEELFGQDPRIFLEVGPGRTLQPILRQHPESRGRPVLHSIRRAQSETETVLRNLGQLWLAGVDVDWSGFYAHQRRRRVPLPTYPFERRRFWIEPGEQLFSTLAQPPGLHKLETLAEWFRVPSWQRSALPGEVADGEGRWLLLVDECGLGEEMARQLTAAGSSVVTVRPGEAFARLGPGSYTLRPAERSDYEGLLAELRREEGIPRQWVHLWTVTAAAGPAPGQPPADALELGFYSLLAQLQALGGQGFAEPLRLAVVSNGVQSVVGDELLWPEKAAVLGPCKVIPEEYSNLRSSSIDVTLDRPEPLAELAGHLIAELRAGLPDPVAAYREGTRWVPSYEASPLQAEEELDLVHRGVYLITGGLGGLGLVFARYLAESFQAGLVLTHHSPFPVREEWDLWLSSHGDDDRTSVRIRELRALEELGSEVAVEQADVADEPTMHKVIKRAREQLGPLRGVIHAAGVAGGGVIQLREREAAAEVLRSKVEGMRVLEAVTADAAPELLVLFSSINSVVGTFGQVDYCAANNVLDAFAWKFHRQRPEMRTVAINWGIWNEVGMGAEAAERDPELDPDLARVGISPAEGVEAWRRILCHHRGPQIVASAVDLDEIIVSQVRARRAREGVEEALPDAPVRRDRHARPDVSTTYVAPRHELEVRVAEIWQEMLGIEKVGLYDNFFDIGGHSLLLAQVRLRLSQELKRDVPLVDLFRFPTIRTLADHLSGAEKSSSRRPAPAATGGDTAMIGMSCRFPGAEDVDEFWRNLCGGVESVRTLSDEELTAAGVDRTIWSAADYVRASAEIRDPDCFDAGLFDFSPREAEILDPQHRIFLEIAWSALEAAGYDPTRFDGRIGVYGGTGRGHYAINLFANPELVQTIGVQALTLAVAGDTLATRVSYKLDLKGPSVVVQSACSTALVAVHMARQALLKGECDMALAGAVAVGNFQPQGYQYTTGGILSPDGHCRAFDAGAAGSIFSSGAGIVVLKRLADAVADGDVIHAVIKGSAINNDGALKVGYTAPSEDGQAEVIRAALQDAQVDADTVTYVEGHGTATPLGDPIEVAALTRVFRASTERTGVCVLGAVKTNIGHTDIAAGAAGLIKTALALEHGLLPPTLHFEKPNPEIDLASSPFRVETELRCWETADGKPRRAGVSSFGIGGTNAHVIVEQAPAREPSGPSRRWQLLVLSAATSSARTAMSERLAAHLGDPTAHLGDATDDLADLAFTCQVGRRRLPQRRFVVCRDAADAAQVLAAGAESKRVYDAGEERGERSVVYLLSGLGDHYAGMGRELYDDEPTFRAEVDRCCELLAPTLGLDLRQHLYAPQEEPQDASDGVDLRALLGRGAQPAAAQPLAETRLAQPAVFVVQVALAQLLREWGVVPRALLGYSLGEYTAAYLAGVLSLEDALALVATRAQLIATVPAGGMLAVPLPEAAVLPLLDEELSLAATNGPEVSVVAGPEAAIDRLAEHLRAGGQVCQRLRTRHAFHSHMLRSIAAEFAARVREVELRPPQLPYLSNVTGTWIRAEEATDPDYWVRHLCQPVRFAEGLNELMADSEPILLEIGPGQALATSARQHPERPAGKMVLATLRDERERQSDQAFLLHTLGRLWLAGVEVDWSGFVQHEKRRRVVLPGYPFERQRFFVEPGEKMAVGQLSARKADLGDWFYLPSWKRSLPPMVTAAASGRWLLIADDEGLAEQVARRLAESGGEATLVRAGAGLNRRGEREWEIDPERPEDYETLFKTLAADGVPDQVVHFRSFAPAHGKAPFGRRFAAAQARGLYSLLWLAQALVKVIFADRVTLTVVTNGVQDVERDDRTAPEKATLLGALRVIPQEYSHILCRNVDLAPAADGGGQEELAALVTAELTAGGPEPVVAYRGSSRLTEGYEAVHLEASPEGVGLRRQGVYLITGGFGQIGLHLAEYLACKVEARLVLVSRSPLPPRSAWEETLAGVDAPPEVRERITRLLAIETAGAELLVVAADAADRLQMQAAVDQARERFGALHGVFHLAGVFRADTLITVDVTDPEICRQQFRPKVDALQVLTEVLDPLAPDFCVLFSSLSVVLGGLGFTAYAAANAFMDAFARARQGCAGVPWISVDWDAWGMDEAEARGPSFGRTLAQFEMHPEEALEALWRVVGLRGVPQIVVSTGDLDARIATWARAPGDQAPTPGLSARQRPELSQAYVAPTSETEEEIAEIWQTLLGIEQVGTHDNFLELGGDSLIGVQLIARLRESFRIQISVPEVFEAPTVAGLATLIAGRDEQEDLSELDLLLDEVAEMSPEEVEEEIRRHQMPASSDS